MNFYLIGAGGHAKVVIEILESTGNKILGVFDNTNINKTILGYAISECGPVLPSLDESFLICVGNNLIRKRIALENPSLNFSRAIHPSASVSIRNDIGKGSVVMAGVSINSEARIGKHCIINTNASVDHDCVIDNFVHLSPNVALAGNITVGEGTHIGIGASVIPGIKIGKWSIVGAGSVIIKDIPDNVTVVGNPARIIKKNSVS